MDWNEGNTIAKPGCSFVTIHGGPFERNAWLCNMHGCAQQQAQLLESYLISPRNSLRLCLYVNSGITKGRTPL